MWIVKMDGDFQALFALESDAWTFRGARQALFPERVIEVSYIHPESALLEVLA
ncbi:hypothetical protein [Variovorax sp. JS1663]|uniref:hypothetical protein n=1 Tax=Variovorax sp. JS1663 TaxID=1851577 RepID=UPI0013027D75|nr:hypothetical protein [Variovorax sp. JS1663]